MLAMILPHGSWIRHHSIMRDLSFVSPEQPLWMRLVIGTIEDLSGRRRFLPLYDIWRDDYVAKSPETMISGMLEVIDTKLKAHAQSKWPPKLDAKTPLVMIGNHPMGIGDGAAALTLAEQLGRPYRVLINNDLLRVPEIKPYSLPIDFSETREAMKTNLNSRAEANRLLKEGVTIVIFPGGGVATARDWLGPAEELPWKTFTASLIQRAHATVLPVFFEGANSRAFHIVSRFSLTLRLSLLISEFSQFAGSTVTAHVGDMVPFEELTHKKDRKAMMEELYLRVHRLDPMREGMSDDELKPRPLNGRFKFKWE